MRVPILKAVGRDLAEAAEVVGRAFIALRQDLLELGEDADRSRRSLHAALVVPLAVVLAMWLGVDAIWWAAISGFMTTLATGSASLHRGAARLGGTILGAALGFVAARWLPYDHLALLIFTGTTTFFAIVGLAVSGHGIAWLFAMITANLVLLGGLTEPLTIPSLAANRVIEVAIGVVSSAIVTALLAPSGQAATDPVPLGWRRLLDRDWPVVQQGLRAALAVVVVVEAWIALDLPGMNQMAITIAAVMAAPALGGQGVADRHAVAERALHRFLGCLLGGIVALLCLALSVTVFPFWLAMIALGIWVCMHIQTSRRGVGYVGTQAGVVFIMTLVQGSSPPASIMPGIDRLIGITGGISALLLVTVLLWPAAETPNDVEGPRQ